MLHHVMTLVTICLLYRGAAALREHRHVSHGNRSAVFGTSDQDNTCPEIDVDGSWDASFTTWTHHDDSLLTKVANLLNLAEDRVHIPKHVLMCGDSTVKRVMGAISFDKLDKNVTVSTVEQATRCNLMEYYGLPRTKTWEPPIDGQEGPVDYGLKFPFCTDCGGCDASMVALHNESTKQLMHTFEYVPVEFALDREFQTGTTNTSQRTLSLYLEKTYRRDLCIASAGLHDVILSGFDLEQHTRNVINYLHLLRQYCKTIAWLTVTASRNEPPQLVERLSAINDHIRKSCHLLPDNTVILNTWNMSLPKELFTDNVHHKPEYYKEVVHILFSAFSDR